MINTTEIDRVYEDEPTHYWAALKQRVSDSPLTTLGVAVGAGALAYGLFKPRAKHPHFAHKLTGIVRKSKPKRAFQAMVGSLALSYLNHRLKSKLRWH